jgi:hypothetical protein
MSVRQMRGAPLSDVTLEILQLSSMASGAQAILLTEKVSSDGFPEYARAFARMLRTSATDQASSGDTQIASIEIDGQSFWLAYDTWQNGVSLEPKNSAAAAVVPSLLARLLHIRASASD